MDNKAGKTSRPTAYIFSTTEARDIAHAIQAELVDEVDAQVWSQGAFCPGDYTLQSLFKQSSNCDYAIMVMTADDESVVRGKKQQVPRDNLIFELGLFVGRLGSARTFVLQDVKATLPSDFDGVSTERIEIDRMASGGSINWRARVGPFCFKIRQAIARDRAISRPAAADDCVQVYENIGELRFVEKVRQLIENSTEIVFIGTGLNIIESGTVRETIFRRVREGKLTATICFGNPYSPQVRARLIEEDRGDTRPTVAAEGIINRTQSMIDASRSHPGLRVLFFNNYPTLSIFSFDRQDFVYYSMGFRKLGNECPAFVVQKPGTVAIFLEQMLDRFLEEAVDAREVLRVRRDGKLTKQFIEPSEIRAVAVYAIPARDDPFYLAGSELLGYDVLNRALLPDKPELDHFRKHVGHAREYGFHLTVADVMYLPRRQIPSVLGEIRAIASDVKRFRLKITGIDGGDAFGPDSVVLTCAEESGEWEKLNAEITVKVRPIALGTNFTLDRSVLDSRGPLTARDDTMLLAYQSPFVFSRFEPHFTLAAPAEPPTDDERQELLETVRSKFDRFLTKGAPVRIDRIYVLEKPLDAPVWDVVHEIDLKQ